MDVIVESNNKKKFILLQRTIKYAKQFYIEKNSLSKTFIRNRE